MCRIARFLLFLAFLTGAVTAASAERRVALVIGNGAYKVSPLANPGNDAEAVAAALRALGFATVMLRKDLGTEAMRAALMELAREATGADVAVVFFAGHGTEREGHNYLIPVDAALEKASDLALQAIALSTVIEQLGGVRKLRLVILDACRNNRFPLAGAKRSTTRSANVGRGLGRIDARGRDTLIVFSAEPGQEAVDTLVS